MSYEAQLKLHYAKAHLRLIQPNYSPKEVLKIIPKIEPLPPPKDEIPNSSPISTPTISSRPTMWQLLRWVSATEGIKIVQLRGAKHSKKIYQVRFIFCYLARVYGGFSLPSIGKFIGGRDHTTILNAVNKIRIYRLSDSRLCQRVAYYETILDRNLGRQKLSLRCPHCGGAIPRSPHEGR